MHRRPAQRRLRLRPGAARLRRAAAGGRNREIDEDALTEVADISGGRYFRAEDADQLTDVLADLPREIGLHNQDVEITVWFVLAGGLLAFTGAGLALWWNRAR